MPALKACKCQAHEQQAGSSRTFGKCVRCSFTEADSASEFGNTSMASPVNSDVSTKTRSEGTDSVDGSEEDDHVESLQRFYGVFHEPSQQGNVERRTQEVSCMNPWFSHCLTWILSRPSSGRRIQEIQLVININ